MSKTEVTVEEAVLNMGYQLEAIIRLLERKQIATRTEILQEIRAIVAEMHSTEAKN